MARNIQPQDAAFAVPGLGTGAQVGIGLGSEFLKALGAALFGDGGQGERIDTASGTAAGFANAKFDPARINQLSTAFMDSLGPLKEQVTGDVARRLGTDSSRGQGDIMRTILQSLASAQPGFITNELNRVMGLQMAGLRSQTQLAGVRT